MATYNGQRGPNVSEFIANLNAIPSAQDMAGQNQDNFNLEDELAMFTNTQFFDFDLGQDADLQPSTFDFSAQSRIAPVTATEDTKGMNFIQGMFFSSQSRLGIRFLWLQVHISMASVMLSLASFHYLMHPVPSSPGCILHSSCMEGTRGHIKAA